MQYAANLFKNGRRELMFSKLERGKKLMLKK
jgi:hypothetical protein